VINPLLKNNYYFDKIYIDYISAGTIGLGKKFWHWIDDGLIDGWLVNGSAKSVAAISGQIRKIQTGYLYHYVLMMVVGLLAFLGWMYWRALAA